MYRVKTKLHKVQSIDTGIFIISKIQMELCSGKDLETFVIDGFQFATVVCENIIKCWFLWFIPIPIWLLIFSPYDFKVNLWIFWNWFHLLKYCCKVGSASSYCPVVLKRQRNNFRAEFMTKMLLKSRILEAPTTLRKFNEKNFWI